MVKSLRIKNKNKNENKKNQTRIICAHSARKTRGWPQDDHRIIYPSESHDLSDARRTYTRGRARPWFLWDHIHTYTHKRGSRIY